MKTFARTAEAIAGTSSKLEKVALLAAYLRTLDDADLCAATRFFSGNPFPQRSGRALSAGGRTIADAARTVWDVTGAEIAASYRETGDLATALARGMKPPLDLGLFQTDLSPATLMDILNAIADASGKGSTKTRRTQIERALSACEEELEAKYVLKILTAELRIGLREGLILDAIAEAFAERTEQVRRAAMAAGDVGAVAIAARHHTLDQIEIAYGTPIAFMLAIPMQFGTTYRELGPHSWIVEEKYDGVRIQAHKHGNNIHLFSRRLNETTAAWPEIAKSLSTLTGDAILDGEIVALRDNKIAPFRTLQTRLQRTNPTQELQNEVPVAYLIFDCLARNQQFLLDEPLTTRQEILKTLNLDNERVRVAPPSLANEPLAEQINDRFETARTNGNEGLILKRTDSPYAPGKRGKWWLKLKRELDTIDAVVVAVEWGNGKRAKVLSDYTFAVKSKDGPLVIGKAFSGLTDAEIAEMTQWFQDHTLAEPAAGEAYADLGLSRHEILVEPQTVVEIAFDIVQRSPLHRSGYSLRFPRIVRLRPDKSPDQIDTIERINEIHRAMTEREGFEEA